MLRHEYTNTGIIVSSVAKMISSKSKLVPDDFVPTNLKPDTTTNTKIIQDRADMIAAIKQWHWLNGGD